MATLPRDKRLCIRTYVYMPAQHPLERQRESESGFAHKNGHLEISVFVAEVSFSISSFDEIKWHPVINIKIFGRYYTTFQCLCINFHGVILQIKKMKMAIEFLLKKLTTLDLKGNLRRSIFCILFVHIYIIKKLIRGLWGAMLLFPAVITSAFRDTSSRVATWCAGGAAGGASLVII